MKALTAAGMRVAPTAPLWRLHTISYRNHRKITVIDGAVGYTGGMNIGREHLSGGKGLQIPGATRSCASRGRRRRHAGGVYGRLVQCRQGEPPRPRLLPHGCDGTAGGRCARADFAVRAGLAMGRHPAALLFHDHERQAARLHPVALFRARCEHRRGAEVGGPGGNRRQGDAERPRVGRPRSRAGPGTHSSWR